MPLLIANTVLTVAIAIFAETYITFLGLGDPALISWGKLIENAFKGDAVLNDAWWAIIPPGVCVTLVILACTMIGMGMEDALNPRSGSATCPCAASGSGRSRERWSPSEPPLLQIEDLHVWFDLEGGELHAVQGVGLELHEGDRLGLVGESGCGKTLILAAMGLLPPLGERCRKRLPERRGHPGYGRGLGEPAPLGRHRHGLPGRDERVQPGEDDRSDRRADGAPRDRERRAGAAAGGRAARAGRDSGRAGAQLPAPVLGRDAPAAAIAMALACKPKILLADEPTTALDVMVQAQILQLLVGLAHDLGLALVLVTHDLPIVAQVCEQAAAACTRGRSSSRADGHALPRPAASLHAPPFAATPDLYGEDEVVSIPGTPPRLDRELTAAPSRCAATARSPRAPRSSPADSNRATTWPRAT